MSENEPRDVPETEPRQDEEKGFAVDLGAGLDEALKTVSERARQLLKKGRYTKVRLKFRGRELATIPLTLFVAAEAAGLLLAGPAGILRVVAANAVGKVLLDVEFINEADAVVAAGKARLLDGELEEAIARFREAAEMDPKHAGARLNLGIALKLKGERNAGLEAFEEAVRLDPDGETGRDARRQIELLKARGG